MTPPDDRERLASLQAADHPAVHEPSAAGGSAGPAAAAATMSASAKPATVKPAVAPKRKGPPLPWLWPAFFCGGLVPLATLIFRGATDKLGADPISTALNQLGLVALIFLLASLACTPLKIVTGFTWPLRVRKLLGLYGFFYACLHLLTYTGLDQQFNLGNIWQDVRKNTFIIVGFSAWLLLIPLAVTSNSKAVRKLGKNWQRIHSLVYIIGPLVIIHFTMRMKADITQPIVYGIFLSGLLSIRMVAAARKARKIRNKK